jgi:hypothetical protein
MSRTALAAYLNDHLAGSEAALELLSQLAAKHADLPWGHFFEGLHTEITADRHALEELMREFDIGESRMRKATAWLAEKLTELKLRLEDPNGGTLGMFESLELLSLGIEGKIAMWRALQEAARKSPALERIDFYRMIERAKLQRNQVEERRLGIAAEVLAGPPQPVS